MPATLTITLAAGQNGYSPDEAGFVKEELLITGASSAAADTGTYSTQMKQPQRVECGTCVFSISGQTVTLTDKVGIGTATAGATVYGYA
jgi:hypothetical protein